MYEHYKSAMAPLFFTLLVLFAGNFVHAAFEHGLPPFPALYTSGFVQPEAPTINAEFRANYMQHKYDVEVTHPLSGFIYISPSQQKVRADAAGDGFLEASLFDFANTTVNGTVANAVFSFNGGLTSPTCSTFFVAPWIPLFTPDFLNTTGAVYAGVQQDDIYGFVSTWQLMFTGIPVTVFLDPNNTLVRFDFAAPGPLRTFATTRFFNIIPGAIDASVFNTSCH